MGSSPCEASIVEKYQKASKKEHFSSKRASYLTTPFQSVYFSKKCRKEVKRGLCSKKGPPEDIYPFEVCFRSRGIDMKNRNSWTGNKDMKRGG